MGLYNSPVKILHPDIAPGRRVLVISDIHANLPYFSGVLKKVSFSDDDILILNGDFLEKGRESLKTLRFIMELYSHGNVIPIMGNCDEWAAIFTEKGKWVESIPHYMSWRRSGLLWDMAAELGMDGADITDIPDFLRRLKAGFPAEFDFLGALPQMAEAGNYVFAHAAAYPDKPLSEHKIGEVVRCDRFLDLGLSFDRWLVVGHYPVMLYGGDTVCANPIVLRDRHIISIDGACVLKDDGQLNCLIIPDITKDDFTYEAYDPFPVKRVLKAQAEGKRSYYIRWGDSTVKVLSRGEEFSHCRHLRTGYEMDILTKYLFKPDEVTDCNDCTDYILPLKAGDEVSVVEETGRGYFVKHNGVSGWYFGELGELK